MILTEGLCVGLGSAEVSRDVVDAVVVETTEVGSGESVVIDVVVIVIFVHFVDTSSINLTGSVKKSLMHLFSRIETFTKLLRPRKAFPSIKLILLLSERKITEFINSTT